MHFPTATHSYILVRWRDATQDVSHKSWKRYQTGVAAFDRTGDMDKASGLIVLDFAK